MGSANMQQEKSFGPCRYLKIGRCKALTTRPLKTYLKIEKCQTEYSSCPRYQFMEQNQG